MTAMRRIHLDFVGMQRPAGMSGWLLLLFGLAGALAVVVWDQWHWQPLNAVGAEKLRSLQAAIDARRATVPKMDDARLVAEWTRAIAVADELNIPWEKLFATLEAESQRPVAILSLDPDAQKREIILTGEAKNFEEMLGYYRLLQQQEIFSGLVLHTHQVNHQDREKPIRFRVTANWMAKS